MGKKIVGQAKDQPKKEVPEQPSTGQNERVDGQENASVQKLQEVDLEDVDREVGVPGEGNEAREEDAAAALSALEKLGGENPAVHGDVYDQNMESYEDVPDEEKLDGVRSRQKALDIERVALDKIVQEPLIQKFNCRRKSSIVSNPEIRTLAIKGYLYLRVHEKMNQRDAGDMVCKVLYSHPGTGSNLTRAIMRDANDYVKDGTLPPASQTGKHPKTVSMINFAAARDIMRNEFLALPEKRRSYMEFLKLCNDRVLKRIEREVPEAPKTDYITERTAYHWLGKLDVAIVRGVKRKRINGELVFGNNTQSS